MSEIIITYLLRDPDTIVPMQRDEFYAEQIVAYQKNGAPTRACAIVNIFLFNTNGELLVQKRSNTKHNNPGLLDKSIGGHIHYGDTSDYTVIVESVQELQTPSIVVRTPEDFKKTLVLLCEYLTTIAIVQHVQSKTYQLKKIIKGKTVTIANNVHVYLGIYDGRIRPADLEAKGILFYALPELDAEMQTNPDIFTDDMHVFMKDLRPEIDAFVALAQTIEK